MTESKTTRYALFKDGNQVTKAHSTRHAVIIEAYEKRIVMRTTSDFGSPEIYAWLPTDLEIMEMKND